MWNVLQLSDSLDVELASALSELVPTTGWRPQRRLFDIRTEVSERSSLADPPLSIKSFPIQRGFTHLPGPLFERAGRRLLRHLLRNRGTDREQILVCTAPHFAPVAQRWDGPVVYWLTDRIEFYDGVKRSLVHELDRRLCRAATLVCPNSQRLAEYLRESAGCSPEKLVILPNATRESNLLERSQLEPAPLPDDVAHLRRPIAGVIGNMAGNIDWLFLLKVLSEMPELTWLFVGPTSTCIRDAEQSKARDLVMAMEHAHFIGKRPYGALVSYARAFDVAVLPYRRCEPTYSGSSTRFYEHLAACRPMISTRGFEELLHKEPLLKLVDDATQAVATLKELRGTWFKDGFEDLRWRESQRNTWQCRADVLVTMLQRSAVVKTDQLCACDDVDSRELMTTKRFGAGPMNEKGKHVTRATV